MNPEIAETIASILGKLDAINSAQVTGLPLCSAIYTTDALAEAVGAYSPFCNVQIRQSGADYLLDIAVVRGRCRSDGGREIIGEFLNHLLVLSVRHRLWSDR